MHRDSHPYSVHACSLDGVQQSSGGHVGDECRLSSQFCPLKSLSLSRVCAGSGFGISQSSRLSSSVSAMRVLNTGSDVEEALADALVRRLDGKSRSLPQSNCLECVCVCLCVCLLCERLFTNPCFYLCLMQSAVGRHAFQGQLPRLLLTPVCVDCVPLSSSCSLCVTPWARR